MTRDDEEAVSDALSRALLRDRTYRRLTRRVLAAQDALKRTISKRAWALYLLVEERTNDRHFHDVTVAIRLALRHRQKGVSPACRRG
jgi:hypothetical protein